jgi:hypothetical protein
MSDKILEALQVAEKTWKVAQRFSNKEKMAAAAELHIYGVFSHSQLAKICRTNVPMLSRRMQPNGTRGGRFEPEALSLLILLRSAVLQGVDPSMYHIEMAVEAGCSLGCVASFTGLSSGSLYMRRQYKLRKNDYGGYTEKSGYYSTMERKKA